MSDFLYWFVLTVIGFIMGWFIEGVAGMIFLGIICISAGLFMILENKIHPHL